jgi:DNA-directed RNA polymerase sigma subunit (sigma70/sigma32)
MSGLWLGGRKIITAIRAAEARPALARMDPRQAGALIQRYGLDDQPERSFRQNGRHLGVSDHTARTLVERAQTELRRLVA